MGIWKPGDSISASSAFGWDECPAQWWFARVLRISAPERSYFILGTMLHRIAQRQLTAKQAGAPILSETEIAELVEKDLAWLKEPGKPGEPPRVKYSKDETADVLIEDAIEMARVWMREVFPQIDPLAIEVLIGPEDGLRLPESGIPVKAILDVIDQDGCIRDLKTGKSKWPDGAGEKRLQTNVYSWAYRCKYGISPPFFHYDLIVRKKRGKKRTTAEAEYVPIKVIPDPALEFGALRRLEVIAEQMRAGRYYPVTGTRCLDCSFEDYCNYHFAELPFAVPQPAQTAPVDGPRYLKGSDHATSPARLLTISGAPDDPGGHGAAVPQGSPEAVATGVPDRRVPGSGEAV